MHSGNLTDANQSDFRSGHSTEVAVQIVAQSSIFILSAVNHQILESALFELSIW